MDEGVSFAKKPECLLRRLVGKPVGCKPIRTLEHRGTNRTEGKCEALEKVKGGDIGRKVPGRKVHGTLLHSLFHLVR